MPLNPKCKHDKEFKCAEINVEIGYKFYCTNLCGYFMDFNPVLYPEGVAFNIRFGIDKLEPVRLSNPGIGK